MDNFDRELAKLAIRFLEEEYKDKKKTAYWKYIFKLEEVTKHYSTYLPGQNKMK